MNVSDLRRSMNKITRIASSNCTELSSDTMKFFCKEIEKDVLRLRAISGSLAEAMDEEKQFSKFIAYLTSFNGCELRIEKEELWVMKFFQYSPTAIHKDGMFLRMKFPPIACNLWVKPIFISTSTVKLGEYKLYSDGLRLFHYHTILSYDNNVVESSVKDCPGALQDKKFYPDQLVPMVEGHLRVINLNSIGCKQPRLSGLPQLQGYPSAEELDEKIARASDSSLLQN